VFRRLLTPKWLGALALAAVFAVIAYYLGQWQYGRHEYKVERNARLDTQYRAAPVPLASVLTSSPLSIERDWTHVTATGSYRDTEQWYVRNRPNGGVYGYEILAPFDLAGGGTVLIDRGWVQNSPEGANVLPPVPGVPTGSVTMTGWVRPGEDSRNRSMPRGQLATINVADATKAMGEPLLGGYVLLDEEKTADGSTPARPRALEPPDRSLGPHQAYAFQWWLSMPVGLLLIWMGIRRELRLENPEAEATRRKKTRIWDEEDY
jgi:cytochrome oxidase assembly protein ShyY1